MKKIILLFILSSIFFSIKAQDKNELTDIIISSLKTYYDYYSSLDRYKNEFLHNDIGDTSFFISVKYYPFNLCKKWQDNHIQYVDFDFSIKYSYSLQKNLPQFQKHRIKRKMKKGINVIFLEQLTLNADTITIIFSKEFVTYNKRHLSFSIGEWGIFKYLYSEEKSQWILIRKELIGI